MSKLAQELKIAQSNVGSDLHLSIVGVVNENATLPEFAAGELKGALVVNLSGLTMINSLGCRVWSKWIKATQAPRGVILRECSPAFIAQVNVLQNFLPDEVVIESIQIPYECVKCNHSAKVVLPIAKAKSAPDYQPCPRCGAKTEMNVAREKYFHFLKKRAV
jgi:hypothetical protein